MPVIVWLQGLDEAGALTIGFGVPGLEQASLLEHPIGGRGADGGDVVIEHHKGQPAIAFQGKLAGKADDRLAFFGFDPVVAWHQAIVFIGLAVAVPPMVVFARGEPDPAQQAGGRQLGESGVMTHQVADRIAQIMRHPETFQLSPSSFFVRMKSSMISAMTSSLRCSLPSIASIFLFSAPVLVSVRGELKAAAPFSKNVRCHW